MRAKVYQENSAWPHNLGSQEKKRESRHHKHANVHRHLLKAAFVASLCGKLMDKVSKSATLQNITKVDSMFQKLGHSREANFLWPSLYGRQKGRKDRSPQTCWWVTFLPPFVTIGHSVTMPIYWFAKYRLLETLICRKSKLSQLTALLIPIWTCNLFSSERCYKIVSY